MKAGECSSNDQPENLPASGNGSVVFFRRQPLRNIIRVLLVLLLIGGGLAVLDFLRFVDTIAALETPKGPKADAIVVLTGGSQRIDQAIELLKSEMGERLLISGVNPSTTVHQIRKMTQSSSTLFECCVDIGHDAIDTIGNANETARWISENGYHRVLVVTNNYHMPRSLLELRRIDPNTDFVAYPVINSDLKNKNWLRDPLVLRTMLPEYVKYSFAKFRYAVGLGAASGLRTDPGNKTSGPASGK